MKCALFAIAFVMPLSACGARSELRVPARDAAPDAPDASVVRALSIAAGSRFACAAMRDASTRCWGANEHSQLGNGTRTVDSPLPVNTHLPDGAARLSAGGGHACGQGPGGGIFCWGSNEHGELGDGTTNATTQPVRAIEYEISAMALGRAHTVFATNDGRVMTFGDDALCQLGDSRRAPFDARPRAVEEFANVRSIAAGGDFWCGLSADGSFRCVGTLNNTAPTWCLPNNANSSWPVTAEVAVGTGHVCAVSNEGRVLCRGANDHGQLGDGSFTSRDGWFPVSVDRVAHIAAGGAHTCVILTDGSVRCWGANASGQIGANGPDATNPGVAIDLGGDATALTLGDAFSCAMRSDGAVLCWGANDAGQLGDGSRTSRSTPALVRF